MAVSLTGKANRRAGQTAAAIAAHLEHGEHHKALVAACDALRSESRKLGRHRPADAALADAELAGYLAAIAAALHAHKPHRPPGCPRTPDAEALHAVFTAGYEQAAEGGT